MKKFNFNNFIQCVAVILMALMLIFSVAHLYMRLDDSQTVTAECEVLDKYFQSHGRGGKTFYAKLRFYDGQSDFEETITLPRETFYNDVQIGDIIPCDVTYDEDGIIDIAITDPDIEQHPKSEGRTGLIIMLALIVFIFGVIFVIYRD